MSTQHICIFVRVFEMLRYFYRGIPATRKGKEAAHEQIGVGTDGECVQQTRLHVGVNAFTAESKRNCLRKQTWLSSAIR